jgi:cytoskeletal protein CcmA (bactofilin family)
MNQGEILALLGKSKKMIYDIPDESFESLIGSGTQIFGRLVINHSVRIDGEIQGSVEAQPNAEVTVHIGHDCILTGDVYAHRILVSGRIDGNIYVRERCDLFETSKVRGNIHYGIIGIEHGAEFYGEMLKKSNLTLSESEKTPSFLLTPDNP